MQAPEGRGFVRALQTRLVEADGRPFYFAGANCYYLLTRAADPDLRHECITVLDDAAAAGLTVIRTWAFADGEQFFALQPSPGVFDERVFRALDWLLVEAARRGLRLLLDLTNYWSAYGGMRQYVAWAWERRGRPPPTAGGEVVAEAFFPDPECQRLFRGAAAALVQRVNTLTGVMYRDDPAILAWGLCNEPRCRGDAACGTIGRWAAGAAAFVKSLDPNHLVTLDTEGFLGPSTPGEAARANPYDCAGTGCDFAAEAAAPALDFACCHLYPDHWLPQADAEAQLRFSLAWLDCHVELARRLRKPLVLSEYGKRGGPREGGPGAHRAAWYGPVLDRCLQHMQVGGLAGTCFWMLAAPSYPDHDGFTIYLSGEDKEGRHSSAHRLLAAAAAQQGDEEPASPFAAAAAAPAAPFGGARPGGRTGHVIRQHAAAVAQLNGRLSPLACQLCEAISRHASGALASRQASGVPAHAPYAPAPGSVPAAATAAAASHTPHIHAHARGLGCRCCDIM